MNHPFGGAAKIGKTLRPTEVLSFGNPQGGTPFMECAQAVGIDLPRRSPRRALQPKRGNGSAA